MLQNRLKIICTRKLNQDLIELAKSSCIDLCCVEFLEVKPKDLNAFRTELYNNQNPLVFTSVHAVNAVKPLFNELKQIDVFAIEGNTSYSSKQSGFNVLATAKNGTALANKIIESRIKTVLHCTTKTRRDELNLLLTAANITYKAIEVYDKNLITTLVESFDGVMFFSPSQVDAFLFQNKIEKKHPIFCIGETTAQHVKNLGYQNIHVSKQSTASELLNTVLNHYNIQNEQHTFIA
ncbi:MAG: uroporphyrinogen-III synthase [Bacteroidia bacterium]